MDNTHRYVVTVEAFDSNFSNADRHTRYMIEMYSAQDAVDAVRTWLQRGGTRIGGTAWSKVTHVEAYDEARHGTWLVQRGDPGRSM